MLEPLQGNGILKFKYLNSLNIYISVGVPTPRWKDYRFHPDYHEFLTNRHAPLYPCKRHFS